MPLDLDQIRTDFPILQCRARGEPLIYRKTREEIERLAAALAAVASWVARR